MAMVDNPLANGKCRPTSRHTTIRCSYIKCMMRRSYCACKRSVHSRRTRHYNQLTIGSKIDSNQLGKLEKNGSERLYAVIDYTYIKRILRFHPDALSILPDAFNVVVLTFRRSEAPVQSREGSIIKISRDF